MNKPMWTVHPLIKIMNNSLIDLPSPSNISSSWNFCSIFGMCLLIQILTGLFLAMRYCPNIEMAFNSIVHICQDVNYGWLLRTIHANESIFFFYCHLHPCSSSNLLQFI